MSLKNIIITGSIGSIATQSYGQRTYLASSENQSYPIEDITGSQAGSWPNFIDGTNTTSGLIVNISQSWSGSNTTPLGIVNYIHNNNKEFYNGEFSGSVYIVTNGNLTDEDCEQFLNVNTTIINYSIYLYYESSAGANASFINRYTAPRSGEILINEASFTNNYINYIKIAKIDQAGHDNSLSLQELTQISWSDASRGGKITLKVQNITEYPSYYLYQVTCTPTWSVGNIIGSQDNIGNFSFSGTSSITSIAAPGNVLNFDTNLKFNPNYVLTGASISYLNYTLSSNIYAYGYTASFTAVNHSPVPVSFSFGLYESNPLGYNTLDEVPNTAFTIAPGGTKFITLTSSYSFIQSPYFYWLEVKSLNAPISVSGVTWLITQSFSAPTNLITSSVVIEPYLLSTFANSDCDVLMNNYSENDVSTFYREVLYENGGITPSNFQQIISGTAQYAEINDYLYNASANYLPRYEGVRTTSPGFNQFCGDGLTNEQLSLIQKPSDLNIIFTTSPNVEQTTTYFGYFTSLKSNSPIFKGTTSPVLKYIIREDGEVFTPSTDEATYYNMVDSFEVGKQAYTDLLINKTVTFNSTNSIVLSGQSYIPVLYSISASNEQIATYTNILNFQNLFTSATASNYDYYMRSYAQNYDVGNYLLQFTANGQLFAGATDLSATFGNAINVFYFNDNPSIPSWGYGNLTNWSNATPAVDLDSSHFTFSGIPDSQVKIIVSVPVLNPATNIYNGLTPSSVTLKLVLYKKDSLGNVSILSQTQQTLGDEQSSIMSINTTYFPQPNDEIYAIMYLVQQVNGGYAQINRYYTTNPNYGATFKIETLGGTGISVSEGTGYWTSGSNNTTSITSSVALGAVIQGNFRQEDIAGSGFDPIEVPANIMVGDEIRFEYDESLSYLILQVIPMNDGSGNSLTGLIVDKIIPNSPSLNINHFTIRRKIKDPITGIALKAPLYSTIYDGFILPEYPSYTLKKTLPTIVTDLYNKTLI